MESRSIHNNLPSIGIASSIARAFQYSWQKTIDYARDLRVNLIQLYLPATAAEVTANFEVLSSNQTQDFEIYFHLPPTYSQPEVNICLTKYKFSEQQLLVIQHEKYIASEFIDWILQNEYQVGLENDNADNELYSYRQKLIMLKNRHCALAAVVDLSRFYAQFKRMGREAIDSELASIIKLCKEKHIPLILHVIDHSDAEANREHWIEMFSGILPWKKILGIIRKSDAPLKSIVFEYENLTMTKRSMEQLKLWFGR